jgi:hypothetical protein
MEDEAWAVCGPFVVRMVVAWLFSWGPGPDAGRALCTALHGVVLHCRGRAVPGGILARSYLRTVERCGARSAGAGGEELP